MALGAPQEAVLGWVFLVVKLALLEVPERQSFVTYLAIVFGVAPGA